MPGLSGTGLIADDLYLLAHHELTGKPYIQPRALGIGLAGGLLAELLLPGAIRLHRAEVMVAEGHPPRDGLARHVLDLVGSERDSHTVRDWLLFIARTAAEEVARRLARSGYLSRTGTRLPWRGRRWVAVNADWAFAPVLRIRAALDASRPLVAGDAALAGLADACGLDHRVAQYLPPAASRSLASAIEQLSPDLRELIAQTQASVDSALLSHRV